MKTHRDENRDLKYQFEIYTLPTIILLGKNKFFRIFEGNYTIEELSTFIDSNGVWNEQMLKPPKGIIGTIGFSLNENLESFVRSLDQLGLKSLPRSAKLLIIGLFLFSPIIMVFICIWSTQDNTPDIEEPKDTKEDHLKKE